VPRLHPNLAELYRRKVINLPQTLIDEHKRQEAAECIRELIEEIRLVPEDNFARRLATRCNKFLGIVLSF